MGFTESNGLERLLIGQVILARLRLMQAERAATGAQGSADARFHDQMLSRVQHRHVRACDALAHLRKMYLPPIQVNIGGKQANVLRADGGAPLIAGQQTFNPGRRFAFPGLPYVAPLGRRLIRTSVA
jgi:hypothetical protein